MNHFSREIKAKKVHFWYARSSNSCHENIQTEKYEIYISVLPSAYCK